MSRIDDFTSRMDEPVTFFGPNNGVASCQEEIDQLLREKNMLLETLVRMEKEDETLSAKVAQLTKERDAYDKALREALGWMSVNLPEMECRGDEDCDHCFGKTIEAEGRDALKRFQGERE